MKSYTAAFIVGMLAAFITVVYITITIAPETYTIDGTCTLIPAASIGGKHVPTRG